MCFDGDCYEIRYLFTSFVKFMTSCRNSCVKLHTHLNRYKIRYVKITPLYTQYVLKAALYKTPGVSPFTLERAQLIVHRIM
jgi:hypothetical protein